jgi:hypothetical protein
MTVPKKRIVQKMQSSLDAALRAAINKRRS